jgi:hypothetical protein
LLAARFSLGDWALLEQAFLALSDQPADSALFIVVSGSLGTGALKLVKGQDEAYDELRKIPEAIGIELRGLVK